jgi:hypothetical protein
MMVFGKNEIMDPLTAWEQAASDILKDIASNEAVEAKNSQEKMLMFVEALDRGDLDGVLRDVDFMFKTEDLLLAMLRGERIDVPSPMVFSARKEIFAAAQVVYNLAVLRGLWDIHPEILQAKGENG